MDEFKKLYPNCETTALKLRKQIQDNTKIAKNLEEVKEAYKEFRNSEEGRKMASENAKSGWRKPGYREERNAHHSESMKRVWSDDNFRKAQSEKIKKATNTEEVHKKHHDRLVRQWKNETYRKNITEKVNEQFDNGKFGRLIEYTDNLGNVVRFRSSWELSVHNILNELGIVHYYEYRKFRKWFSEYNKYLIYRPDFYIPSLDRYLEVKPDSMQSDNINQAKRAMVLEAGCVIDFVGDNEYSSVSEIKKILNIS